MRRINQPGVPLLLPKVNGVGLDPLKLDGVPQALDKHQPRELRVILCFWYSGGEGGEGGDDTKMMKDFSRSALVLGEGGRKEAKTHLKNK